MSHHTVKSFSEPEETRNISNGTLEVLSLADRTFIRSTFQPGWRWSNDVKPVVGGESCQTHHVDYLVSGTLHVRLDDGTEFTVCGGDVADIPPGHDGWVDENDDEPVVSVSLIGTGNETSYGKSSE